MSGLGKRASGGGSVMGGLQGVNGSERIYCPDMFRSPEAGWPITADAPQGFDAQSITGIMRAFDSDAEHAVAFSITIPVAATTLQLRAPGRAGDSPAGPENIVLRLHARVGAGAWSGPVALGILNLPNDMTQSHSMFTLLSAFGVSPGDAVEFLLSRNPGSASDTLLGRWFLYELGVNFA